MVLWFVGSMTIVIYGIKSIDYLFWLGYAWKIIKFRNATAWLSAFECVVALLAPLRAFSLASLCLMMKILHRLWAIKSAKVAAQPQGSEGWQSWCFISWPPCKPPLGTLQDKYCIDTYMRIWSEHISKYRIFANMWYIFARIWITIHWPDLHCNWVQMKSW